MPRRGPTPQRSADTAHTAHTAHTDHPDGDTPMNPHDDSFEHSEHGGGDADRFDEAGPADAPSPQDPGNMDVPLGPTLAAPEPAVPQAAPAPLAPGETRLEAGLQFIGNALLRGPCTVAGEVQGHLRTAPGATVSVVVDATGRVRGDISARQISVFGATEGLLDAGTGDVALHDGARIYGTVRYGRIRVDGADLNATLERATAQPT